MVRLAQAASKKLVAAAGKGRRARVRGNHGVAGAERQAAAVSHVCVWTRELGGRIVRWERQLGWRWTVPRPAIRCSRGVVREAEGGWTVEQRGCSGGRAWLSRARLSGVRRVAGRGRARVGIQRREGEAAACRRRGSLVTHDDGRGVRVCASTRRVWLARLTRLTSLVLVRLAVPGRVAVGERGWHGQDDGRVGVGCTTVVSVEQKVLGRGEILLVRLHKASPAAGATATTAG